MQLITALVEYKLAIHRPEALRLVRNGQIRINDKVVRDTSLSLPDDGSKVKISKGNHPDNTVILPIVSPQEA